jgi:hypothetical protein
MRRVHLAEDMIKTGREFLDKLRDHSLLKQEALGKINRILSFHYVVSIDTPRTVQKTLRPRVLILLRVNSRPR